MHQFHVISVCLHVSVKRPGVGVGPLSVLRSCLMATISQTFIAIYREQEESRGISTIVNGHLSVKGGVHGIKKVLHEIKGVVLEIEVVGCSRTGEQSSRLRM